jgi:hypothetical protein
MKTLLSLAAAAACLGLGNAQAAATFVNGLAIPGDSLDLSGGTSANNGRVGFFSDLYFDPNRNEWWGISDRGPGGGTISYDTRVQRFTIDVNATTGAISNFEIQQTIVFKDGGQAMNGLAPTPSNTLGRALDPEGLVILPKSGNFLVSDEYGPSVKEFDRSGNLVRSYKIPANLVPKVGADINYNAAAATMTSGREGNRGFEGLAVSPDGKYAYAMLQNGTIQDGWSAASRGLYTRIVKFDTSTGEAVGQYAYKLESAGQGRGISAIVALGDDKFLVLERNNRGIGAGATLATADKNVYKIDLSGATDVSGISLPATGALPAGYAAAAKDTSKFADLDANTLAALGNKSPEKWEGLAIGPKLSNGSFLLLAGTDNDYSVTQNGSNVQFDVYFDFSLADPYAGSIQCPLGAKTGCFLTSDNAVPATPTGAFVLVPGILHAYTVSTADIGNYTAPVPEPETYALMLLGLAAVGVAARRRRA